MLSGLTSWARRGSLDFVFVFVLAYVVFGHVCSLVSGRGQAGRIGRWWRRRWLPLPPVVRQSPTESDGVRVGLSPSSNVKAKQ